MASNDIQTFLTAIESLQSGYKSRVFHYLAIKNENKYVLVQGRLFLNFGQVEKLPENFKSENILAGLFELPKSKQNIEKFIKDLIKGEVSTPDGIIYFEKNDSGAHNTFYHPYHPEGTAKQQRWNVLNIRGGQVPPNTHNSQSLDWEVMAAETPYSNIQELANYYNVAPIPSDYTSVDIVGYIAMGIAPGNEQKPLSYVHKEKAVITLFLAEGLDKNKASLGYKIQHKNLITKRATLPSKNFSWKKDGALIFGTKKLKVPEGAIVHCFASYNGKAQHHYLLFDKSTILNPRRAVLETFDSQFATFDKFIKGDGNSKSEDFEAAVSWLLWMLGFSPAVLGLYPKAQEAPDIIVTSPEGHYLVVECTTGLLKAQNKIASLHTRTEAIKESLRKSANGFLNVLPVIVTSKPLKEIEVEIQDAEKHGMLVLAREDIFNLINNDLILPNASQLYNNAVQTVAAKRAKYEEQRVPSFLK